MDVARASAADEEDQELGRRTNEILRFMVDRGLVDLFVGKDGEFEFSPTWVHDTDGPSEGPRCLSIMEYARGHLILLSVLTAMIGGELAEILLLLRVTTGAP